jgi:hypothetical protein
VVPPLHTAVVTQQSPDVSLGHRRRFP